MVSHETDQSGFERIKTAGHTAVILNLLLVGREGLEPSTNGLKVRCSNQLSYRPAKPSIVLKQPPSVKL